jgi:predicted GNAT family N-acyltransferase
MEVHVVLVPWSSHDKQLQSVRETVFIQEQGVPRELEWDGEDEDASHFLAVNEAGQAIGCARLLATGQIGRMAVIADQRSHGIGNRLLAATLEQAKQQRLHKVFLHAQVQVTDFYRKAGFLPSGVEFLEAGIPHLAMDMELPIPFEMPALEEPGFEATGAVAKPAIHSQESSAQPEKAELKHLQGENECLAGLVRGLQKPVRAVQIYSQFLDHALFDQLAVVDELSRFVRSGPPVQLQVLIHSNQLIISRGHRLLELARRMDNKIQIRRVPEELALDLQTSVVWDQRGYWLMPDFREYEAVTNLYDPVQASRLGERFDYLWNKGIEDSELRVLRL